MEAPIEESVMTCLSRAWVHSSCPEVLDSLKSNKKTFRYPPTLASSAFSSSHFHSPHSLPAFFSPSSLSVHLVPIKGPLSCLYKVIGGANRCKVMGYLHWQASVEGNTPFLHGRSNQLQSLWWIAPTINLNYVTGNELSVQSALKVLLGQFLLTLPQHSLLLSGPVEATQLIQPQVWAPNLFWEDFVFAHHRKLLHKDLTSCNFTHDACHLSVIIKSGLTAKVSMEVWSNIEQTKGNPSRKVSPEWHESSISRPNRRGVFLSPVILPYFSHVGSSVSEHASFFSGVHYKYVQLQNRCRTRLSVPLSFHLIYKNLTWISHLISLGFPLRSQRVGFVEPSPKADNLTTKRIHSNLKMRASLFLND